MIFVNDLRSHNSWTENLFTANLLFDGVFTARGLLSKYITLSLSPSSFFQMLKYKLQSLNSLLQAAMLSPSTSCLSNRVEAQGQTA